MGFGFKTLFCFFLLVWLVFLQEEASAKQQHYNNVTAARSLRTRKQVSGCNLFQGKWVFDPSYPFYDSSGCPFIDPGFDCLKYGRPDKQFLQYSWKPDACNVPRYPFFSISFSLSASLQINSFTKKDCSFFFGFLL